MTTRRLTSCGVAFDLDLPDSERWRHALPWILPPAWSERLDDGPGLAFTAHPHPEGWEIITPSSPTVVSSFDEASQLVERTLRETIALRTRHFVFIHAGVVAVRGRAVVIPGQTYTGKTTLVRALAAAGCGYVSDEYALVDPDGMIHPYPRHLSIRRAGGRREHLSPAGAGFDVVTEPLPPGAVVTLPRTAHAPPFIHQDTQGPAAMALMENTVVARVRPHDSLRAAAALARGSEYWRGQRNGADEAATAILRCITW